MQLMEIIQNFQSAKAQRNEIIRDTIETISDEKEKADDAIRLLKAKLQNTLSKFETVRLQNQLKQLQNRKKILQDRIGQKRKQILK
jgi:galactokinase/mevalonate kinase-like predicted kinase